METLKQHFLLQCNEAEDERKLLLAKHQELVEVTAQLRDEAGERERHVAWLETQVHVFAVGFGMARFGTVESVVWVQVRHLETSVSEGDKELHSELNRLLKDNEKLQLEKESTEGSVLSAQDQLGQAAREINALKEQVGRSHRLG